jgi:hypothetical protein
MLRSLIRRGVSVSVLGALQLACASPAQATGLSLVNSQMLAAVQLLSGPNLCVIFTHDRNSNRTAQNNVVFGAPGTVWGSAVYGCFAWTAA